MGHPLPLAGCIPVVVMDNVSEVFESLLDWRQFSVRIAEADVEKIPEILKSIVAERNGSLVVQMQRALAKVWHRFAWASSPLHKTVLQQLFKDNAVAEQQRVPKEPLLGAPSKRDGDAVAGEEAGKALETGAKPTRGHHYRARRRYPVHEDAFSTMMMWLHSRIAGTR